LTDIASINRDALPSGRQLLKLTAVAIIAAAVILVTAVLPAEYGIDPTGIGQRIGLTSMSASALPSPDVQAVSPEAPTTKGLDQALAIQGTGALSPVWRSSAPHRTDELTLRLKPNQGAEIKASMKEGERFIFTWRSDGAPVNFDMHGEKLNARSDDFTSYWKGRDAVGGSGEFQAPFAGTHGWFWRNRTDKPVVITVRTAGFYEKLYNPAEVK
jgi:hypothetical protein